MRFYWIEVKKIIGTIPFVLCVVVVPILFALSGLTALYRDAADAFIQHWTFSEVALFVSLIPCVTGFALDWERGTYMNTVLRTGVRRYAWCKLLAMQTAILISCALSKLLVMFYVCSVNEFLYHPEYYTNSLYESYMGELLKSGHAIPFMLMQIVRNAVGYLLVGTASGLFSALYPKRTTTIIAPVIFYYLLNYLAMLPGADYTFSGERMIQQGAIFISNTPQYNAILIGTALICLVLGFLYRLSVGRRLAHA